MFKQLVSNNKFLVLAALLILVILYPPRSLFNLHTDDFLIRAYVTGEHPEFLKEESRSNRLFDTYFFFGETRNKTESLKEYGALPWWADDSARMSMFRPISAATHYIDHVVLEGNLFLIQIQSFLWLLFLFFSIVFFYKQFQLQPLVLVLASAIFIIDLSHMTNFYWLAARNVFISTALGLLALSFHMRWRESEKKINFIWAVFIFVLSLLSAEAGIATGAYLLAYAVFLDKQKPIKGIVSILPYGLLVIVWRTAYQFFEYGSKNISLYVDPVNSLSEFLFSFLQSALLIITAVMSGTGVALSGMSEAAELWYLLFGFVVLMLSTFLISPMLFGKTKESAQIRFFYSGFLLSIIPFCALSTYTTRSGVFAYIGFSALLALLINKYLQDKKFKFLKNIFITFALFFHLLIPVLYSIFISLNAPEDMSHIDKNADLEHALASEGDKYIVYLNYPSEVNAMFLPYTWNAEGLDEPLGLVRLVPGLNSYTLTRTSDRNFILKSDYHFVLNQNAVLKSKYENIPRNGLLYGLKEAMGFTSNNARKFHVSEIIKLENYTVEVRAVKNDLPSELLISFSESIEMSQFEWRLWRWEKLQFEKVDLIDVSGSMKVLNQWDEVLRKENPDPDFE